MQFPGQAKPSVGILFDCAMGSKIDDALALAMLHGFEGKNEARIAAIGVCNSDLKAAQFCDAVGLFYASATDGTCQSLHAWDTDRDGQREAPWQLSDAGAARQDYS